MKKLISIYICLFLVLFPVIAHTQDETIPEPEKKTVKITVELLEENLIKWENTKYILVDEDIGNLLFERYDKYPELELKIDKLAELTYLYSEQLRLNTEITFNLQEQNNLILKENVGLKKIISEGDPWWKSPILWTILGCLAGAGTTIAIFKIAKEI